MADILVAMGNGQYGQAEELLDAAQRLWDAPRLQKAFQEIGRFLAGMKAENGQREQKI